MSLQFSTKINLTEYEQNSQPVYSPILCMGNEPNNDIWQYLLDKQKVKAKKSFIKDANFDQLSWDEAQSLLTSQKVRRLGIKHFPQIGAMGYWTLEYEDKSQILAPIHAKVEKYGQPNINVEQTSDTLIFNITNDSDYDYKCYRIILRLEYFALEYITYETTLEVPKPVTTGTYDIYCVGYIHEGESVSEDSNHITVDIQGTQDTWPGPEAGADLFVTDIEIVEGNKIQMTRSDGFKKQSDTTLPNVVSASFLADGRLALTLGTGEVIVTDNAAPGEIAEPVSSVSTKAMEVASGTTASTSIGASKGLLVMNVVVHRYDITSFTEGWKLLVHMPAASLGTDDFTQRVSIYYKYANSNTESFNITQATAGRFYINTHVFRNAATPELYIPQTTYDNTSSVSITLNKQTQDVLLWVAHVRLYGTTAPYDVWSITPEGPELLQLGSSTASRLLTIVDTDIPKDYKLYMAGTSPVAIFGIRIPAATKESQYVTKEDLEALEDRIGVLEETLVEAEALVDEINGEVV